MTDSTFKSKRTITVAANLKPKFIATASTCIGKVDVIQYPPTKEGHRFAVSLTTTKGDKRTYYRSHMQKKPSELSKRLKLKNKKRKLSLIQTSDYKFELKHVGLPSCHIEIVDYGVKPPPTKYNGIGPIVASIVGANVRGYEPVQVAQEEEDEEGWDFGPYDSWVDEMFHIAETIGGVNNPYESGGTGNDDEEDDEEDDNNDDDGGDEDDGELSWWDWLWGYDGNYPEL